MPTLAEGTAFSELEKETEQTRADLVHTVDELHGRVSPQAIKAEVKAYARATSDHLIESLKRKSRENPLQAVAVGAGLAYPAWRFLINIPAPILLVGTGIALTHFGRSSHSANPPNRLGGPNEDGSGEGLADHLSQTAHGATSNLSQTVEDLKGKVANAAEQAKSAVSSGAAAISSRVAGVITNTTDSAGATAAKSVTAATDALSRTYRSGLDAAARTGDQLSESVKQSKDSLFETIESHPFIVGGIGLLIGAAIASALPVTKIENRLFGETSGDLKDRARDIASGGLQAAKTATQDVYEESVSRAQQEGLSPEVVRQTVKSLRDKAEKVVAQGADALGEEPEGASSTPPSVVPHA